MEPSSEKLRLRSMDVLKGMIMTVIVFSHMIFTVREGTTGGGMPVIIQVLYLGLMVFYILSGYFYRPGKGFRANMTKRLKQIGIPLIICAFVLPLILFVYLDLMGYDLPASDYIDAVIYGLGWEHAFVPMDEIVSQTALTIANVGGYFLYTMLWGFMIFYLLADYVMDDIRKAIVTIAALLVVAALIGEFVDISLPMFIKFGPIAAAFMFFGACLAKFDVLENVEYGDKRKLFYWLLPVVLAVASVVLCYFLQPNIKFDHYVFGDYGGWSVFPFYAEAILMFLPIVYLGFIFSKIPLLSVYFDTLGKHTLGTILLHPMFAKIIVAQICTVQSTILVPSEVGIEGRLAIAVAVLIICIVVLHFGPKLIAMVTKKGKKEESS
jgi:hypothetical protein